MSLYNRMMGVNPNAATILHLIGVANSSLLPRFRDAALIRVGDEIRMIILTRSGARYADTFAAEHEVLRRFPGFVRDYDDDYDETFHTFEYRAGNAARNGLLAKLVTETTDYRHPLVRFRTLAEKLNDPAHRNDPDVVSAVENMRAIMGPIIEKIKSGDAGPMALLDSDYPDLGKKD